MGLAGRQDKAARHVLYSKWCETGLFFVASSVVHRCREEGENRQINVLANAKKRNVLPKNTGSSWKKSKKLMDYE